LAARISLKKSQRLKKERKKIIPQREIKKEWRPFNAMN